MVLLTGRRAGGSIAAINVTPMADIMIVLLIIFMVMTPLIVNPDVDLPDSAYAEETNVAAPVIVIRRDTSIALSGIRLDTLGDLSLRLQEHLATLPDDGRTVYLKADEGLPHSEIMKILDLARQAGAEQVVLIAERRLTAYDDSLSTLNP